MILRQTLRRYMTIQSDIGQVLPPMSHLVSHINVMARRYRRRRFGRRRRPRRSYRRRRAMLRRKRMLRRHRRGGRRFTVSIQRDFALVAGSYIPFQLQLSGDGQEKPGLVVLLVSTLEDSALTRFLLCHLIGSHARSVMLL